jgi:FixJ family two-component response regulator/HPt (histidine-containing phosphotransfer) domain-containing protein
MFDEYDQDFVFEALEMVESAQNLLLKIESAEGTTSDKFSEEILRTFHTLKGACGMFGLQELEKCFHFFEDLYLKDSKNKSISVPVVEYLLKGLDAVKNSLESKEPFVYGLSMPSSKQHAKVEILVPDDTAVIQTKPTKALNKDEDVPQKKAMESQSLNEYKSSRYQKIRTDESPLDQQALVYIIEDNNEIREQLRELIESLDYRSKGFEDPVLALDQIRDDDPDLIITDINMPNISGMDFISRIYPMFPHLPVIICSGYVTKEICIEFLSYGAAGIIEKPYNPDDLLSMVQLNVNRYRAYRLLGRSIRYMQYQFSDLENFLRANGLDSVCETLRKEMKEIITLKRRIDRKK